MAEDTPREIEFNVVRGAVRIGRHPATLDRALRAGELAFRWEDGRRLIKGSDLDEWAARTDRRRTTPHHPIMAEAAAL